MCAGATTTTHLDGVGLQPRRRAYEVHELVQHPRPHALGLFAAGPPREADAAAATTDLPQKG